MTKQFNIYHYRDTFGKDDTLSKIYFENDYFSECLEDEIRPFGKKVHGETAIPENHNGYNVTIVNSPKFGKCITLYTDIENGIYILKYGGIEFKNIRVHGGNDDDDTDGCPLVAKNRVDNHTIQGTMKKAITAKVEKLIKEDYTVKWKVFNNAKPK